MQDTQLFLDTLGVEDRVHWRFIPSDIARNAGKNLSLERFGSLRDLQPMVSECNRAGYHCYAIVNEGGTTDDNILKVRAYFADFDRKLGQVLPEAWPEGLEPTMIIESGGGWHVYWVAEPNQPVNRFSDVQIAISHAFNSDRAVHNRSRIMRVPGTTNWKYGSPCRVVSVDPTRRYTGDRLLELLASVTVADTLTPRTKIERARKYLASMGFAVEGEHGDDKTFRAAAVGHSFGIHQDEWWPILQEWNLSCKPPWKEAELQKKLQGACKQAQTRPFGWRLLSDEAPHHCLPDALRDMVTATCESLQVHPNMVALPALGVVASCAQRNYYVQGPGNWAEPLGLYVLSCAESSARKSSTLTLLQKPIYTWQREQAQKWKKAEKIAKKSAPDEVVVGQDFPPAVIIEKTTAEALEKFMQERGSESAGVFLDEVTDLLRNFRDYTNSGKSCDYQPYLNGYSGKSLSTTRITRSSVELGFPSITIVAFGQPDALEKFAELEGLEERGLGSRFMYCFAPARETPRSVTVQEAPKAVLDAWAQALTRLLAPCQHPDPDYGGRQAIRLSPAALEQFNRYRGLHEIEIHPPKGKHSGVPSVYWYGKMPGRVLRISALFALMRSQDLSDIAISEQDMNDALSMLPFLEQAYAHAQESAAKKRAAKEANRPERLQTSEVLNWLREQPESFFQEPVRSDDAFLKFLTDTNMSMTKLSFINNVNKTGEFSVFKTATVQSSTRKVYWKFKRGQTDA